MSAGAVFVVCRRHRRAYLCGHRVHGAGLIMCGGRHDPDVLPDSVFIPAGLVSGTAWTPRTYSGAIDELRDMALEPLPPRSPPPPPYDFNDNRFAV